MIITKYVVFILYWLVEVVGALSTNKLNGAVVGSSVGSINDVVWMIDGFVGDTEVGLIGGIIGELEGADVGAVFNATEGILL